MRVGCGGEVAGEVLAERLIRLRNSIDLLEVEFSHMAGEFAHTKQSNEEGYDSPIAWLKANCHMAGGAAADRVCVDEQLGHLDRLGESCVALAAGEIGFAHQALIAHTSAAVGERLDERKLLRQAPNLSVKEFRTKCMHARHQADPDGFVDEEKQGVEARSLTLTNTDEGVVLVNGILDKVGGAALRTALEPLAKRAGKDDDRLRDRRLADALVDLSMHALDTGLVPQRTHMQVTTSLETLLGFSGAPAAEMEFSLPISAKAVERLAYDCSITRILLDSDSMVIDVGRAKRKISGPTYKALKVRDQGCVWPGCDRRATWTSGHHLVHWVRGGPTNLPNLALLCYRHHWMVHEGEWQIVRSNDGEILIVPPTMTFGPPPRGPD